MENRMKLNKRPVYELPDEVVVEEYLYSRSKKRFRIPNFEPDLCIVGFGRNIGDEKPKCQNIRQIWIKTDNKGLIRFIQSYYWRGIYNNAPNASLSLTTFKKIILEEFYEKQIEVK